MRYKTKSLIDWEKKSEDMEFVREYRTLIESKQREIDEWEKEKARTLPDDHRHGVLQRWIEEGRATIMKWEETIKKYLADIDNKVKIEVKAITKLEKMIDEKVRLDFYDRRVEIIVLKYKNPEVEKECVRRIIDKTSYPYKLNLYDNRPNTANMSRIWNYLVKQATCPYVLIMDSDAFVETDGWLEKLMDVIKEKRDAGVVVPIAGEGGSVSTFQAMNPQNPGRVFQAENHVSGYCFLFRRKLIEEIGEFDEEFYVFGQDSDWFERILEQDKWKIYYHTGVLVRHGKLGGEGGTETKAAAERGEFDWRVDTERAQVLFEMRKQQRKEALLKKRQ